MKNVVEKVSEKFNLTKKLANEVTSFVIDSIIDEIKVTQEGKKFRLSGLGSFSIETKKARTARNPKTGEAVEVPAKKALKFKPSKDLKEEIQ